MALEYPIRGRQNEVDLLLQAWHEVSAGQTRLVVVSGDPGTGKTRLVQELYHRLRDEAGGAEYWPENFGSKDYSSTIAPQVPNEDTILAQIPYFWWGIHCVPENKSDETTSVVPVWNHRAQLWAHLVHPGLVRQNMLTAAAWVPLLKSSLTPLAGSLLTAGGLGFVATGLEGFSTAAALTKQADGSKPRQMEMGSSVGEGSQHQGFTEAVINIIQASQAEHDSIVPRVPVILVVDDIQWLDGGSRLLLRSLCQRASAQKWQLLVICTVRSNEEPQEIPQIKQVLRRATDIDPVVEIQLDQSELNDLAVEDILYDWLTYSLHQDDGSLKNIVPSQKSLDRLKGRAGNNALYVVNYAKLVVEKDWLDEEGELSATDEQLKTIPKEIKQIIYERLDLLGEGMLKHSILCWGSVQGYRFSYDLALLAANNMGNEGLEAANLLAVALAELVDRHHMLRRVAVPEGCDAFYEFTHQLHHQQTKEKFEIRREECGIAECAFCELLRTKLEDGSIENWPEPERLNGLITLSKCAKKRKLSAGEKNPETWEIAEFVAGELALDTMHKVGDNMEAEPLAIQLWEGLQAKPTWIDQHNEIKIGLINNLTNVFSVRGNHDLTLSCNEYAKNLFESLGDMNGLGVAWNNIGIVHDKRANHIKALESYGKSLEICISIGDENGAAATLGNMGNVHLARGDYEKASSYLNQSLDAKKLIGDEHGIVSTLHNLGIVNEKRGDYGKALKLYNQALEALIKIGDEYEAAMTLGNMGGVHSSIGEFDEALELLGQSMVFLKRVGDEISYGKVLRVKGAVHDKQGNYDQALSTYEKSLEICERYGDEYGIALNLGNIGNVHLNRGNLDTALELFNQSWETCKSVGDKHNSANALLNIGNVYLIKKEYDRALEFFELSLNMLRNIGDKDGEASVIMNMGLIYCEIGNLEEALVFFKKSLDTYEIIGNEYGVAQTLSNVGIVFQYQGDYDKALHIYQQALVKKELLGDEHGVALTLYNLASVEGARRNFSQAIHFGSRALEIFIKVKDKPYVEKTNSLLERLKADESC